MIQPVVNPEEMAKPSWAELLLDCLILLCLDARRLLLHRAAPQYQHSDLHWMTSFYSPHISPRTMRDYSYHESDPILD